MTTTDLVPPAVAALYSTARALWPTPVVDPAAGVDVLLSSPAGRPYAPRALAIGCSWAEELEAIRATPVTHGAGMRMDEVTDVACFFWVGSDPLQSVNQSYDQTSMAGYRAAAGGLLAALDDAVRYDMTFRASVALATRDITRWLEWREEGRPPGVFCDFVLSLTVLD